MEKEPPNSEEKELPTPTGQTREFISNSTAHGLKLIFEKQNPVYRRFFWFVLFTSALVVLTIMMYNSYLVIVSYPFRTVTTLNMTSSLEFPAVTICNKNPIDKKMPENETGSAYKGKGGMEKYLALPDVEVDDFFTHCQYGTDDKNCSEILVPFTLLSERCFVLRPKKLHKATRRMPLKLTVFVNRAAYRLHAHAVGVKFHVHAPVDVPDMSMPRSVAPPGYVTNVAMRKTEYEFLPSPYTAFGDSKCTDTTTEEFREEMAANPENYFYQLTGHYKGYSVENCVAARAGRQAVKECNCTLSTLESEYNLCTFSDMKNCFISTSSRLLELAEAGDLLGCPRPCHSEEYLTVVSTSYFPSPPVEDELIKAGVIGNVSDIRANYLQLEFYYEDLRVHKTMHVAEYGDWQSILGLLGGNMGFFLGASVLTIAELLDFIVCLSLLLIGRLVTCLKPKTASSNGGLSDMKNEAKTAWN